MRRILRLDSGTPSVAREAPFDSEGQLHRAIAQHPEVLPAEDVGLGPLVVLANELDLGAGPMDLLAVDARGRLAIVEFKRGTEKIRMFVRSSPKSWTTEALSGAIRPTNLSGNVGAARLVFRTH